jgi:hypothetical protein
MHYDIVHTPEITTPEGLPAYGRSPHDFNGQPELAASAAAVKDHLCPLVRGRDREVGEVEAWCHHAGHEHLTASGGARCLPVACGLPRGASS